MTQFVNNTIPVIPRIFETKILGESRMSEVCRRLWIALELLCNSGNDDVVRPNKSGNDVVVGFGVCEGSVG